MDCRTIRTIPLPISRQIIRTAHTFYGKDTEDVLRVMDDLMKSVEYFNPKLHKATIQKLKQL